MKYYSTNGFVSGVLLKEAVIKGLASDNGLFMPEYIPKIPQAFFKNISGLSLPEISFAVACTFLGDDVDSLVLKDIVFESLNFDIPLIKVTDRKYVLELYHGPTLAFKDVGARFMARLLAHFNAEDNNQRPVNVLVATSGDTGGAVANGFLNVPGVQVYVLYPKGKVSHIQESQFTTLGQNITSIEINGTFDDCQTMVKQAFMDVEINNHLKLTSANSINLARLLPQMFYYFYAYAQLAKAEDVCRTDIVVSVPSGNFGNLTAGLIAKRMGLPIKRFIAANNSNDVVYEYLQTGQYNPRKSVPTIANAMDVGNPSNFSRILDLYGKSYDAIAKDVVGAKYSDLEIGKILMDTFRREHYLLDPHGAVGYGALRDNLQDGEVGICLETAHPAKFKEIVENIIGEDVDVPQRLLALVHKPKKSISMSADFNTFKEYLLSLKCH